MSTRCSAHQGRPIPGFGCVCDNLASDLIRPGPHLNLEEAPAWPIARQPPAAAAAAAAAASIDLGARYAAISVASGGGDAGAGAGVPVGAGMLPAKRHSIRIDSFPISLSSSRSPAP